MARMFGTDGVRGVANKDLSCELALKIGKAGAYVLTNEVHQPRILLGRDTRLSGDMLSAALTAGICSVGGDVIDVGVIPTPAMAYLARAYEADAAVMVSASHNTMEYNGIKWFDGKGFKLSDRLEDEIEKLIKEGMDFELPTGENVGHVIIAKRAVQEYKEFLKSTARNRFDGLTVMLDCANGAASEMLTEDVASVYIQQPSFFGQLEDATAIGEMVHAAGAMYIMGCNPIALAIMKTPKDCGADIAVGEGQPLGMPLSYGGPYLGFMATLTKHMRKLPGRIVGQTTDSKGDTAYVLSLQAREQHIRREKASSNICSNQALCAFTAGLYMATMGPDGMAEAARQSMAKAHYLAAKLCEIPGVLLKYKGDFFHEFVTEMPRQDEVLKALEDADILGGLPVEDGIMWCATEKVTRAQLDRAIEVVKEVLA